MDLISLAHLVRTRSLTAGPSYGCGAGAYRQSPLFNPPCGSVPGLDTPAPSAQVPARPIGRPAASSTVVLSCDAWWVQLLSDVRAASQVAVSSLVFDHLGLTNIFLEKLQARGNFELVIVVDKESFEAKPPHAPQQGPRLRSLQRAGAEVVLCKGSGRYGRMHGKALVCDRRIAYSGSANFTVKSASNAELCFRFLGSPVADILGFIISAQQRGERLP